MARDAFVDALADPNLHCRILERDPSTLEESLKVASRLEALSRSVGDDDPNERWDESGRRRNRQTVSASEANDDLELKRLIGELRAERLNRWTNSVGDNRRKSRPFSGVNVRISRRFGCC